MIEYLLQLDENIFLALHHLHRSVYADNFSWLVSSRWVWVPMYAALLYWISVRQGWRKAIVWTLAVVLAVTLADQICASVIRPLVGRLRPAQLDNPLSAFVHIVRDYRGGLHGFPSCHAANTFAVTTVVALAFRVKGMSLWFLVWALLNCLSRVYLGVHYPGDLFVGAIIGMCSGGLSFYLARICLKKLKLSNRDREESERYNLVVVTGVVTLFVIALISLF